MAKAAGLLIVLFALAWTVFAWFGPRDGRTVRRVDAGVAAHFGAAPGLRVDVR